MTILHNLRWSRKDVIKRKMFGFFEIKKLILKSLLNNSLYKYNWKLFFSNLFYNFPMNSSISRYRNFCLLQGEGNSVFKLFKISFEIMKIKSI